MDQFTQYSGASYYGGGGFGQQPEPMMQLSEQKKAEKRGLFIAAAKLGALLLLYEVLTYVMSYAYYYVIYFVKAKKFTLSFDVIREYFRNNSFSISSSFYSMLGNLFIVIISLAILLILAVAVFKVELKPMLIPKKEHFSGGAKWFTLSMSMNIAVSIVVSIAVAMMSSAGVTVPEQDFSITDSSTRTLVMQFMYVVLLGPVCEELLYRGIIISILKPYGKGLAVFFSAFIFGFMHGNIPQFVSAFAGGLVFAAIAVKYDSLVPTMIMHILNNTAASIYDFTDVLNVDRAVANNIYYSIVIICAVIGMYLLFIKFSEIKPKEEKTFALSSGERRRAVFLNVVMLVYMGVILFGYISSFISANS